MKKLTKTQLIIAFNQGCLDEHGKNILIEKFLKLEKQRQEETRLKIQKTMRRTMKKKWKLMKS